MHGPAVVLEVEATRVPLESLLRKGMLQRVRERKERILCSSGVDKVGLVIEAMHARVALDVPVV